MRQSIVLFISLIVCIIIATWFRIYLPSKAANVISKFESVLMFLFDSFNENK